MALQWQLTERRGAEQWWAAQAQKVAGGSTQQWQMFARQPLFFISLPALLHPTLHLHLEPFSFTTCSVCEALEIGGRLLVAPPSVRSPCFEVAGSLLLTSSNARGTERGASRAGQQLGKGRRLGNFKWLAGCCQRQLTLSQCLLLCPHTTGCSHQPTLQPASNHLPPLPAKACVCLSV